MDSDSKLPPDDNVSKKNSDDDRNAGESSGKENGKINSFKPSSEMSRRKTNLTVHWQSLGIGAGIAIACIFSVFLIVPSPSWEGVNMINTDSTQVLDEITIREITSTKKPTIASFYNNASPILGDTNAPLTLVEFGDYQCTYCKKFFHETEESILINYIQTGKVKMLFKDFIVVNEDSVNAASAAHCANDQKMFWQYHSTLYNNWDGEGTGWASFERLHKFASSLGLDMNKLMTEDIPPLQYAVEPILPEGFACVAGRPKSMKSWTMLDLIFCIQNGLSFWGHKIVQGDCLGIFNEDGKRRLKDRIIKLGHQKLKFPTIALEAPYLGFGLEESIK